MCFLHCGVNSWRLAPALVGPTAQRGGVTAAHTGHGFVGCLGRATGLGSGHLWLHGPEMGPVFGHAELTRHSPADGGLPEILGRGF